MAGETIRTWMLTGAERSALLVMLQVHQTGMDWLGLTNLAIPSGLSLDVAAAALAKPVQLGYVEQYGERGAIYRLTAEGRRIAATKESVAGGPAEHERGGRIREAAHRGRPGFALPSRRIRTAPNEAGQ
jgi:hypothetical protein